IAGDHSCVAAAVPAHLLTERRVQIEGERMGRVKLLQPLLIEIAAYRRREMRRRRIAGIARNGLLPQHCRDRHHHWPSASDSSADLLVIRMECVDGTVMTPRCLSFVIVRLTVSIVSPR